MTKQKRYYIAYGSNLNVSQMAHRCPTAKVVGKAYLHGWRLLFRGGKGNAVATIERHKGGRVPVLVWELKPLDEFALDRYEGYPYLYRKETVEVMLQGKEISAMVYIMNTDDESGFYDSRPLNQPSVYYYGTILSGYVSAGFNVRYLHHATARSVGE